MVYLYPKTIQTSTGRSAKYGTQQLSNPQALCSDNTLLAYWGVKNPTWKGNYMRNWPDSLTSYSGSYNKPEIFYATGFSLDTVSPKAKLTSLTVEYKWEEISYSCGSADCYGKFQKPTISIMHNENTLSTIQGAIPDRYRYNNNKVNQAKVNTDNADLATLHSHSIDIASSNLTVNDLKDIKIKFNPAPNTSYNHLRIVMQFIRIKISYEDYKIDPLCRIKSEIDKKEVATKQPFNYKIKMHSSNGQFDITKCKINIPKDVEILNIIKDTNSVFDINTGLWTVNSLENNNAEMIIQCQSSKIGIKKFNATIINNADSIDYATSDSIEIISKSTAFDLKVNQNLFKASLNSTLSITISLVRSHKTEGTEKIIIDTDGLITSTQGQWSHGTTTNMTHIGDGKWEVTNINFNDASSPFRFMLYGTVDMNQAGDYTIVATHQETNTQDITKSEDISVIGELLSKEYLTFKVEDGSDIQYNTLMFTEGDDLVNPLTYEIEDDNLLLDNLSIIGENRKLPVGEAKYIKFILNLNTSEKINFKNILAYVEANNGEELVDIVLGGDDSLTFFDGGSNRRYFIIDEINSEIEKEIKFIVQSDIEQTCDLKIVIFNEDKWEPSHIIFEDIPNIKLLIEGTTDDLIIDDINNGEFTLYYIIENQSEIYTSDILRFKIEEPTEFKRISYHLYDEDSTFNNNTRVWQFNNLKDNNKHKLAITYKATRQGIYQFLLKALDKPDETYDDQHYNEFVYNMMVNIHSMTDINTYVNNPKPYHKELIDFTINVQNYIKKQTNFNFEISDIGQYDTLHDTLDYSIEYIRSNTGTFTPNESNNNIFGTWHIDDVDINKEYNLTLTLKPIGIGTHVIRTIFTDNEEQQQKFDDKVTILEANHKIDFDVSHAIYEGDKECPDCKDLIPICDEDFINLKDDIYFLFTVTNNENNTLNNLTVYARISNKLLQIKDSDNHNIKCYPNNNNIHMNIDNDTKLLYFNIKTLNTCESKTFCIKISPKDEGFITGEYISYFGLTTRNAHVKTKQLFLTVDNTYTEKKLEHEVIIYNTEKTHRYFRYELDGSGNLFKFYNKGDRSLRTIDMETNNVNALETYRGTNLRQIYKDIKNNSKYVEPELLRIGSNAFDDRGYELYPDGFMRRFGLLKSEIFHYTGQLPKSTNLVDYAMKWDVDSWDTKVWAGGLYQNGVFDITVDYSKIPTNFNILDPNTNPIKTLQALVDRTKPFGTKGVAYYSNTTEFDLNVDCDIDNFMTNMYNDFELELDPVFGLISWYNRHDNSVAIYHDLTQYLLDTDTDVSFDYNSTNNNINITPTFNCSSVQYDTIYHKKYINECIDIVQQIYNKNSNVYGIAITKPTTNNYNIINDIIFNQNIELLYPINKNESITLTNEENTITIQCTEDKINNFNGFRYYLNNELINQINFNEVIYDSLIRIEYIDNIFHFWCTINNKNFYHLGYSVESFDAINVNNNIYKINEQQPITFQINDTDNIYKAIHQYAYDFGKTYKWNNLKNINQTNKYASFENNIQIDRECHDEFLAVPKLLFKYNNLNLHNADEITDISVKINAHTNKENFKENININLFKNADYYITSNDTIRNILYPNKIQNIHHIDSNPEIRLQIKGITICSECLHTALGYYDECPFCHSSHVTHFEEQQEATICYNCGWVYDGWHDKCNHCLSRDIERVMVDVNQTYCNKCHTYSDDYYPACPKCFSEEIIHVHNNDKIIDIFNNSTNNIEPILVQTNDKRINILDLEIPLDKVFSSMDNFDIMSLTFDIANNNNGQYYYCTACDSMHAGYYEQCPYCNSEEVLNFTNSNIELQCYIQINSTITKIYFEEGGLLLYGNNEKTINLLKYIENIEADSFKIIMYVDNLNYTNQHDEITKLSINETDIDDTLNQIQKIDISIDNININTKYIDEDEWYNINEFYGEFHEPIIYDVLIGQNNTNVIELKDFDNLGVDSSNAYLYIHGLNKSNSTIDLVINIIDRNKDVHAYTIENINDSFFDEKVILSDIIPLYLLKDIIVQLQFKNINDNSQILIYDVYIATQENHQRNIYHSMHDEDIISYNNDDEYLFKTNNLWQLNTKPPYYLDGNQLRNGLLCYIDFGKLNVEEYIRLYNVELLITYQNKKGQFITDYFPISLDKNEKMINGDILLSSSDILTKTKGCVMDLNNLEYDIFNNTNDEKTLSSMPLNDKIYQSFIAQNSDITQIDLQYFGRVGYPSQNITLKLYDSYNNNPDNLIAEYNVTINNNIKQIIAFEVNANLNVGETYWIELSDDKADDNNYHRFRYNKNVANGILMTSKNNIITKETNYSLSYATYSSTNLSQDCTLPMSFAIDIDSPEWYDYQFKNYHTLYRNNINPNSNAYLTNLLVKYGYEQEW